MPLENVIRQIGVPKACPDVLAHFITRRADAGPQCREKRRRIAVVMFSELLNRLFGDTPLRPAPTAVDGCDHSPGFIDNKDRQAIGRLYNQNNSRHIRGQDISLESSFWNGIDESNVIRVNLVEPNDRKIFPLRLFPKIPEGQTPGTETVPEPGDSRKSRNRKIFRGLRFGHCSILYYSLKDVSSESISVPFQVSLLPFAKSDCIIACYERAHQPARNQF